MLETLIVARAVLYGRSSQPFSERRFETRPGTSLSGVSSAVWNVALKVSRWVAAHSV